MIKVSVSSVDNMGKFKNDLLRITGSDVLVGVPEEEGSREGETITNAELAYIHTHGIRQSSMRSEMNPSVESGEKTYSQAYDAYITEHGSPLWQSPPRPIIEPAIEHNKAVLSEQMKEAILTALDGKDPEKDLVALGEMAQNAVRDWFENPENGWPENSPLTIAKKGSDKPLIDTGALRTSITYTVRKKDGT